MDELIFKEDTDVNNTLIHFCEKELAARRVSFTASKIIDKSKSGIDKYSFELCLENLAISDVIPKSYNLIKDDKETSQQIKIEIRNKRDLKDVDDEICGLDLKQRNTTIIGGTTLISDFSRKTLGCIVSLEKKILGVRKRFLYALTCAHGTNDNSRFNYIESLTGNDKYLGQYDYPPIRDLNLDFSLIPVSSSAIDKVKSGRVGKISNRINEYDSNLEYSKKVNKYGSQTNYTEGYIVSAFTCSGNEPKDSNDFVKGLIEIKGSECKKFSQKGDSGSLVLDERSNPLAIIIAENECNINTLALPIETIHKKLPTIKFNF